MNKAMFFLYGAGIGAGLMFLTDPQMGRRRRSIARDKVRSLAGDSGEFFGKAMRDVSHRASGFAARGRSVLRNEDDVDDEMLSERVRSNIGHVVSHPRAVQIETNEGRVTLTGHVFSKEAQRLLRRVSSVRGVREVEDRLQVHDSAEDVPELQGGFEREEMPANWSPALQFATAAATALIAGFLLVRRRPFLAVAEVLGSGLLLRSKTGATGNHFDTVKI